MNSRRTAGKISFPRYRLAGLPPAAIAGVRSQAMGLPSNREPTGTKPMNFASDNAAGVAPSILEAIAAGQYGVCHRLWRRRHQPSARAPDVRAVRARRSGVPRDHRNRRERPGAGASQPALGGGARPCGSPRDGPRMRRAGIFRQRVAAGGAGGRRRQAGAGDGRRRARSAFRTAAAPDDPRGGDDHAGERIRHRLPGRRNRGAVAPRP